MKRISALSAYTCLAACVAALVACSPAENAISTAASAIAQINPMDIFSSDVNLQEKNYAAADFLVDRMKNFVTPGHSTIKAAPLLDIEEPRLATPLGKQIPDQVGERLIQLGYNVDLNDVSTTSVSPEFAPVPLSAVASPDYILSGSYLRKGTKLDIHLRIQDSKTGMERASFDYQLPRNGEIKKSSTPEPSIYQTPGGGMGSPSPSPGPSIGSPSVVNN